MNIKNKEYFEYCESVKWSFNKISMYCNKNKLSLEYVLKSAKEYAYEHHIYKEEDIQRKIIYQITDKNWLSKWINQSKKRMDFYNKLGGGDTYEFKLKLLKQCYNFCESIDYDRNKLIEFSNILDVKLNTLHEYTMEYYIYILGNSIYSWNIKNEEIKKKKNKNVDSEKVQEYVSYSKESKELYQSLECTSYSDFTKKLPKFCYDFCESVDFDINKIKEYSKKVNISYQTFRNYARDYANDKDFKLVGNKEMLSDNIKKMGLLKNWISYSEKRKRCYEYLGKGNYDEFKSKLIKACYRYAESVNFDKTKLKELAEMIDVVYPTLIMYIKKYMKNVLNLSSEDITTILNNDISDKDTHIIKKQNNNTISEDIRIIKWIDKYEGRKKIYLQLGRLPFEEFKILLYKMCYEFGISVDFDEEEVEKFAKKIDISSQLAYTYMRKYAIYILKMDEKMWKMIRNKKKKS